jgi:phosphoglycolate phosphatase-like HAD superfamily hydrolase
MRDKNSFDAALLDFDMTLVNMSDLVDWEGAGKRVRNKLLMNGFEISELSHLPVSLLREAASYDHLKPETRRERWMVASDELCEYEFRGAEDTTPKEGCVELLSYLHSQDISVAITSSNCSRAINYCIEKLFLKGMVAMTVSRDDVLWEMKPHVRAIQIALDGLDVKPERAFGLGDSVVDMEAFRSAGMTAYGVTGGMSSRNELLNAGAKRVFGSLNELIPELSHSTR